MPCLRMPFHTILHRLPGPRSYISRTPPLGSRPGEGIVPFDLFVRVSKSRLRFQSGFGAVYDDAFVGAEPHFAQSPGRTALFAGVCRGDEGRASAAGLAWYLGRSRWLDRGVRIQPRPSASRRERPMLVGPGAVPPRGGAYRTLLLEGWWTRGAPDRKTLAASSATRRIICCHSGGAQI